MKRRPVFVRMRYAHPEIELREGERYNFTTAWVGRAAMARMWKWLIKDFPAVDAIVEFKRLPESRRA